MKILAIEHDAPHATQADFTPDLLKREAARTWELHPAGVIRELYFHAEKLPLNSCRWWRIRVLRGCLRGRLILRRFPQKYRVSAA